MTYDYRIAARPIKLDKTALKHLVDSKLIPQIESFLKQHPDRKLGSKSNIAKASFTITPVGGHTPMEVTIQVDSAPSRSENAVTSGRAQLTKDLLADPEVSIFLYLNGWLTPQQLLEKHSNAQDREFLSYGLYSVLIHELTHAMEANVMHDSGYALNDENQPADLAEYVNAPVEVRAFMQQIVDEVLIWAGRRLTKLEAKGTNQGLVASVLKRSTTWKRVSPRMNASNRAKVLSAVYDALDKAGHLF